MVEAYIISAVVYASLFALMAIGLTLTYLTTKVPNFAYGSFVTIGVYTAYTLFKINGINPYLSGPVSFIIAGLSSVAMYLIVMRPLVRRGSSIVALMIATFAIDIAFTGIFGIYTDYLTFRYHLVDSKSFYQLLGDFKISDSPGIIIAAPSAVVLVTIALYTLLTRTRFGVAMRASIENPSLARVLGINVELVYVTSWFLAGGFAGLAGSFYTLWLPGSVSVGSDLIVEIFSASILGGLSSLFGAILGGVIIGGSEILVTTGLALGFGINGTLIFAFLLIMIGVYLLRRKMVRSKISGLILLTLAIYLLIDIALGLPFPLLASSLVNGFGVNVITFQKAIPLLIMVFTLLILPRGIVSIDYRRLLRKVRR